jgi:thiopurine S-methyltransferase
MGDIKFHQGEVHPQLLKHGTAFPVGKVLVPLCGKSQDMAWLHSQGHQVVGVELSAIACEAFFSENKIVHKRRRHGEFSIFEGGGIQLWSGDFFHAPPELWNGITGIYDRAALIALPAEYRKKYSAEIINNVQSTQVQNFRMLLITVEYSQDDVQGPPFSITESEIQALYQENFEIQQLERYAEEMLTGHHPKFLNTQVREAVYLLTTL